MAISDVVGAYLLAEMEDHVLVKLTGIAVDVLCRANEKYKKFVVFEKGKKVIYLKLERALYGCIQSALLWYNTFVTKLQKDGFLLNRYDPCVANKEINGNACRQEDRARKSLEFLSRGAGTLGPSSHA